MSAAAPASPATCKGRTEPLDKLLAIFDALHAAVTSPGYNGCALANASAGAGPGSVEAAALRTFRNWLNDLILELTAEAGFADPEAVADRLRLLYDGTVANSQLETYPAAAGVAKEMAELVLETSVRT